MSGYYTTEPPDDDVDGTTGIWIICGSLGLIALLVCCCFCVSKQSLEDDAFRVLKRGLIWYRIGLKEFLRNTTNKDFFGTPPFEHGGGVVGPIL